MSRAFIVLARNDISESLLQALDLQPNTSQRLPSYTSAGQTGYLSQYVQNDVVTLEDIGLGSIAATGVVYGLRAYLLDVVDDNNAAMSAGDATTLATSILDAVDAGTALTVDVLNALVVDVLGAGTDFDGSGGGSNSNGLVIELLRILSGEVYRVNGGIAAPFSGLGGAYATARAGAFVTAPNITRVPITGGAGGQLSGVAPLVNTSAISQTAVTNRLLGAGVTLTVPATADLNFRNIRVIADTPDLHRSCAQGALSVLKSATFLFNNPSFVYGAGGTAETVNGDAIAATGASAFTSRAVAVYDASGNVI